MLLLLPEISYSRSCGTVSGNPITVTINATLHAPFFSSVSWSCSLFSLTESAAMDAAIVSFWGLAWKAGMESDGDALLPGLLLASLHTHIRYKRISNSACCVLCWSLRSGHACCLHAAAAAAASTSGDDDQWTDLGIEIKADAGGCFALPLHRSGK